MNCYLVESLAIVTLSVIADSEDEAREVAYEYQGAEFEATASDVNGDYPADLVELRCVSTRLTAGITDAWSLDHENAVPFTPGQAPDPEQRTLIAPHDAAELSQLVAALRVAAEGDSNDAEIDAGIDLRSAVEALLHTP